MLKTKLTKDQKLNIVGGSKSNQSKTSGAWWNNAIGFGVIGQTIVLIMQTIFTIVNSFTSRNDESKNKVKYGSDFSKSTMKFRISKYPSNSTIFI